MDMTTVAAVVVDELERQNDGYRLGLIRRPNVGALNWNEQPRNRSNGDLMKLITVGRLNIRQPFSHIGAARMLESRSTTVDNL